jgi:hypothetical protein
VGGVVLEVAREGEMLIIIAKTTIVDAYIAVLASLL